MSSLKNPFGEKNGKLILISDISPKENGKKCGCIINMIAKMTKQFAENALKRRTEKLNSQWLMLIYGILRSRGFIAYDF